MTEEKRVKRQALDGTRVNAFAMAPEDLTIVGIDTNDGPEHPLWQPRVKTLKRTITAAWVQNILKLGVLETVLVRKNGPRIEVVAGRRRVLGAREANKTLVEAGAFPMRVNCMVRKGGDGDAMDAMIAENEGRLDDSPVVKAQTVARYLTLGRSEEEIAVIMSLTVAQVKNLQTLLELSDNVQKLVDERRLGLTAALTLRDLPRADQDTKAAEYIDKGVTVVEAKRQSRVRQAAKPKDGESEQSEKEVRGKRPGAAVLRALVEDQAFLGTLSSDAANILRWVAGADSAAARVRGLTAKLRELGA